MKKPMILIDASRYELAQPTGVEVYSNQLIEALLRSAKEQNVELTFIAPAQKSFPAGVRQVVIPFKRFWTLLRLSLYVLKHRLEIAALFVPSHILPLILPRVSVTTIHDVSFVHAPSSYSFFQRHLLRWSTKRAAKHATYIVAVSEATKRDLVSYFHCDPKKVHVLYSGFNREQFRSSFSYHATAAAKRHLTKQSFLLYIGRVEKKKNLITLIEAYKQSDCYGKWPLVLVGKHGVGSEEVMAHAKDPYIICTGYLTNDDAYSLLQDAAGFVFPSALEGFGFPVLEALALKTPVIAHEQGALSETGGSFVRYFDGDKRALRLQLNELYSKGPLSIDDKALQKHFNTFSWKTHADGVLSLLRKEDETRIL